MSLDKTEKLVFMPEIITYKQTIWTVDETGIDAISWVDEREQCAKIVDEMGVDETGVDEMGINRIYVWIY